MIRRVTPPLLLVSVAVLAGGALDAAPAQSVVIDQGVFVVSIHGNPIGTEEFSIRRSGFGNDATFIARGVVTLTASGATEELRALLGATPPDGAASRYQIKVSGAAAVEITLGLVGPRFESTFVSDEGREERDFRAQPGTRIVEHQVAHHFYFLRNVREDARVHVIEPRSRADVVLVAGTWADEEIRFGRNPIAARRVVFTGADGDRIVWFDRQGRVLRVEIPATGYLAVREDLVG